MAATDGEFANLHMLIVDDDNVFLDLLDALLRSMGVKHITRADSGADAFHKLAKTDRVVDCILCDYSMAYGNGLQLLQAIRLGQVKHLRPDTCFVLVTASATGDTVAMALELDVNGCLVKPVTPEKLRAAVTKARAKFLKVNFQKYSQLVIPV